MEAQRQADATPIPKLGERAEAAVAALAAAPDDKARAALWRGMMTDKTIGGELQRFGGDAVARPSSQSHQVSEIKDLYLPKFAIKLPGSG